MNENQPTNPGGVDESDPRHPDGAEFARRWLSSAARFFLPAYVTRLNADEDLISAEPGGGKLEKAILEAEQAWKTGLGQNSLSAARSALVAWRKAPPQERRKELAPMILISEMIHASGRTERALRYGRTLERWGVAFGEPAAVVAACIGSGNVHLVNGSNRKALGMFRRARHLCESQLPSRGYRAYCSLAEAVAWRKLGDLRMAEIRLAQGIDDAIFAAHLKLAARDRPRHRIFELSVVNSGVYALGLHMMRTGNLSDAAAAFAVAIQLSEFVKDSVQVMTFTLIRIECLNRMKQPCDWKVVRGLETRGSFPVRLLGCASLVRGDVYRSQAHMRKSLLAYRRALGLFRRTRALTDVIRTHLRLCDFWLDRNKVRHAGYHLSRARSLRSEDMDYETILEMRWLEAELAWIEGRRKGAVNDLIVVYHEATRKGFGYMSHRASSGLARMTRALSRPDADDWLSKSGDTALRCGVIESNAKTSRDASWDVAPSALPAVDGQVEDSTVSDHLRDGSPPIDLAACGIVSRNPDLIAQANLVGKLAPTSLPILIRGETGTGKDLFARLVHSLSPRRSGPFVSLNCAALSPDIMESELFGHRRGAFTGAHEDKAGLFRHANGGTLFLDEIGDMEAGLQARILRTLETREVRRVGDEKTEVVDTRFVAATNQDLDEAIKNGRFRRDLYFRLKGLEISIPPLRSRPEDIEPLAEFFLARFCAEQNVNASFHPETLSRLQESSWPGNVRELRTTIERGVMLAQPGGILLPAHVGDEWTETSSPRTHDDQLDMVEKSRILKALEVTNWNQTKAAAHLRLSRTTLGARMKRLGIARR